LQAGELTRAVPALEQAVLLAPEQAQNHYQLALAYRALECQTSESTTGTL